MATSSDQFSLEFWRGYMGKDLPDAESQPHQPAIVEDGKVKLFAWTLRSRFKPGTKVAFAADGDRIIARETADGVPVAEDGDQELELDEGAMKALGQTGKIPAMVVRLEKGLKDGLELMPIEAEEHASDILGPRIIDEIRPASGERRCRSIVRHIVKGFEYGEWTSERLCELEDMICSEPLASDPVKDLASGDDWIAWRTRNEILSKPGPGDDALRERLEGAILEGQGEDGSLDGSVTRTAFAVLRALSVGVAPDDPRLQKAASWLLDLPEPAGRPGMWMLTDDDLKEWNAIWNKEVSTDRDQYKIGIEGEPADFHSAEEQQQVFPVCTRNHTAPCDAILHPSATVADALCRCGHEDHPRVKAYANTILQAGGMFGYFCACWGVNAFDHKVEDMAGRDPDFNTRTEEHEIALKSMPYGYARDAEDLLVPADISQYAGIHRPDLSDTNGWWPYRWKDIGVENYHALVGAYWQNADCWAKTNRALAQFPGWSGTIAEFFSIFQLHLYQTSLGEWNQGHPGAILRWIAEATRVARARQTLEESQLLRFAKLIVLKTVPWLREHQKDTGLWHHDELPRWGGGEKQEPMTPRLGTYHIAAVLKEFGLLGRLAPRG